MKVLDLFCGLGGWSKPFIKAGYDCTGIDIHDLGYPGRFINADINDWEPDQHYDIVLASPPCTEFSIVKKYTARNPYDERQGLDLVYRTFYLISQIKPKYWVIENVKGLTEFLPDVRDIVRYGKKTGRKAACLWGNFPDLPFFENSFEQEDITRKYFGFTPMSRAPRALIPKPLSDAMFKVMTK